MRASACARVCIYARCDAMCDEAAAMCKNCECDVDGSDGEPMPHIRYAHSEPRGCDVASGLHAPGSYPPGPDHLQSLTSSVNLTTKPFSPPFFFFVLIKFCFRRRSQPPSLDFISLREGVIGNSKDILWKVL